jgi:60 kDa SS-A/Ro ribonucleoprotein
LSQLSKVARIPTHVMMFTEYLNTMRGWGRSVKTAIGNWYTDKNESQLAYHLTKYQNRNGWSNRDLLRLAHVNATDPSKKALLAWSVAGGLDALKVASESWTNNRVNSAKTESERLKAQAEINSRRNRYAAAYSLLTSENGNTLIAAFEAAKKATSPGEIARLIRSAGLTREMIPTQFLNDVDVWEALLEKMPMTAMIRNLGKMSAVGLLKPLSSASKFVVGRLNDVDYLRKSRVHPMAILLAQGTYRQGHGRLGSNTWTVVPNVVDALEDAFYNAFTNIIPTGKSIYIAHDVSGSMGAEFTPGSGITCAQAGAAMGLIFARTEKNYVSYGFVSEGRGPSYFGRGSSTGLVDLKITAKDTLQTATQKAHMNNFGGTDCALPMIHAGKEGMEVDAFIVITDNETWAGKIHPTQALKQYRKARGVNDTRLIVMGMTSTEFSISDPTDPFNLDVAGFDAGAPALVSDFIRGSAATVATEDDELGYRE